MVSGKRVQIIIVFLVASSMSAEPSLTIYNNNFAIVRDSVNLDLKKGENEVSVTDITAQVEPDSIILRDPSGKYALHILEQNYRSDPVSQELLLSLFEGKEIEFVSEDKIIRGKIIRSGYDPEKANLYPSDYIYLMNMGEEFTSEDVRKKITTEPIIEVDGKLRFSLPGKPLFPSLSADTILKPTLNWVISAENEGKLDAELGYITGGLSWNAAYNIVENNSNDKVNILGWVNLKNQSGKTFEKAKIKLMAGDVNKIKSRAGAYGGYGAALDMEEETPVSEKSFDEYHLYTLNRQTSLRDQQTKQVEFLRADNVETKRIYVYDGAAIDYRILSSEIIQKRPEYGTQSNSKVWTMREVRNSQENKLGIPLPKGRMRFYKEDDDGQLEFVGENNIDHTPKDETLRIYTGNAFDLVGQREQTDYQIDDSRRSLDESFEVKVRNHKDKDSVEIRVVEHLYRWRTWVIAEKSDDYTKTDGRTVEFRVMLKPKEEKVITYKVHYTW